LDILLLFSVIDLTILKISFSSLTALTHATEKSSTECQMITTRYANKQKHQTKLSCFAIAQYARRIILYQRQFGDRMMHIHGYLISFVVSVKPDGPYAVNAAM